MYHLPTQTLEDFSDSLNRAIQMDIDHISSYGLILEPKLNFIIVSKRQIKIAKRRYRAEMYQYLMNVLGETSFKQYEISNFASLIMNQGIIRLTG